MQNLATIRSRLRPGLTVLRTGPRNFLLVNPETGAQFSFGAEERYLLHLLEETDSPDEILKLYQQRFGKPISQRHLLEFVEQLGQIGVVTPDEEVCAAPFPEIPTPPVAPVPAPLSRTDSRASLNRFFDVMVVLFGWLVHPIWTIPILLATAMAITILVRQWHLIMASAALPTYWISPLPLIIILASQTEIFLSLPHTIFLGIVARRYGGRVREYGFHLYEGMIPNFYCDWGDSYLMMKNDRGRWALLSASIWCFLAIGSVSILAWSLCRPDTFAAAFWVWLVPPCLLGLFFHLNPFFKLGCYYMICTHFDDPHLRERALAETKAWLAGRRSPEALSPNERYWFRVYGLGFYIFRLLFDTALILILGIWIIQKFKGPGAVVGGALLLFWYRAPLGRVLMETSLFSWLVRLGGGWRIRWPLRLAMVAAIVAVGFIPYNYEVVGECRLIPLAQHGVRTHLYDEIVQMHVKEGDQVEPGAVIATLSGRGVMESYLTTRADLDKAQASLDLLRAGYRPENLSVAEDKVKMWQSRLRYNEEQMGREERLLRTNAASKAEYDRYRRDWETAQEQFLSASESLAKLKSGYREEEIRAAQAAVQHQEEKLKYYENQLTLTTLTTPIGGKIVTPYLQEKKGQHAKPGDLLAVVQDTSRLRVEVSADDAAGVDVREGMRVNVRLYSVVGRLITGKVQRVALIAEPDRAIGLDPVRTDQEISQEQMMNAKGKIGTSYHVRVYVDLDEYPLEMKPDMTGYARIVVDEHDYFWNALARPVVRFLRTTVWSWLP
jgi:multidrug efflux pump subunit AcrA (membrane-fusion protein)